MLSRKTAFILIFFSLCFVTILFTQSSEDSKGRPVSFGSRFAGALIMSMFLTIIPFVVLYGSKSRGGKVVVVRRGGRGGARRAISRGLAKGIKRAFRRRRF